MQAHIPRLLVAAPGSGSGKTSVVCGMLRALAARGLCLRAAKCGPDYLDPLFTERVLNTPSCNLDPFLAGPELVRELAATQGQGADLLLIEGVMGYYDGIAHTHESSSYDVARITNTPVVLVVDARGKALSVAAEVRGFLEFRAPSQIAGVILNHVSEGYYPRLRSLVESEAGVPVLGYLPHLEEAALPSRHLGLVRPAEVEDLERRLDALERVVRKTVNLDALLDVARQAPALAYEPQSLPPAVANSPVIAVARDEAFCFYYHSTLRLLEQLGARLAFFSPLRDACLPAGTCGLYLGGGYPELHARKLSSNESMREGIRASIAAGMPTIAECGGFLYLHRTLEDKDRHPWPMVSALEGSAFATSRLGTFGYATLTAKHDSLLCDAGATLAAHEFHYWGSTNAGDSFCAQKPYAAKSWDCVIATPTLHAGFPHLYLRSAPEAALRFVCACIAFDTARKGVAS